jgi:uncharacterized protein DUF4238
MAVESKGNIARAHHYISQFYLAGFTSSGSKKGTLYVHDLKQPKSWPSNTAAAGYQKDFYRINLPGRSPDEIEKILSLIEAPAATVIKELAARDVIPSGKDFGALMQFVALMAVRIPRLREIHARFEEDWARQIIKLEAELPPERLAAANQEYRQENPGSQLTAEQYKQFAESDEYDVGVTQDGHMHALVADLANVPMLASVLAQRTWNLLVADSQAGEFVCTDNPVVLDWAIEAPIFYQSSPGFAILDTIVHMPLTRHHALIGNLYGSAKIKMPHGEALPANRDIVASVNRLLAQRATRFIYSAKPDFEWKRTNQTIGNEVDFLTAVKEGRGNKDAA